MFPFAGMIALEITEVDNILCGLGVALYSQLDWGDAEDDRAGPLMYDTARSRTISGIKARPDGAHAKTIELRNVMERRNEGEKRPKGKIIHLVNSSRVTRKPRL